MSTLRTLRPAGRLLPAFPSWGASNDLFREFEQIFGPNDRTNTSELYRSEDGKTYLLKVLLPGFAKDDVNVDVSKNHISVDASRPEAKDPEGFIALRTAIPTSLSYREQVPATLDPTTAEAELVDGVLTVTVSAVTKDSKGNRVVVR